MWWGRDASEIKAGDRSLTLAESSDNGFFNASFVGRGFSRAPLSLVNPSLMDGTGQNGIALIFWDGPTSRHHQRSQTLLEVYGVLRTP